MNKQGYSSAQALEQAVRAVARKSHKDTETGFRSSLALNQPGHCRPPRRTLFRTRRTEAETMMYPYTTLEGGTEVTCSQIIPQEDIDTVLVHFERPSAEGFDSARCKLPSYEWTSWEGTFSDDELRGFEEYLRGNAHLIYRHAASKGVGVV